jgi:hypothetical protein
MVPQENHASEVKQRRKEPAGGCRPAPPPCPAREPPREPESRRSETVAGEPRATVLVLAEETAAADSTEANAPGGASQALVVAGGRRVTDGARGAGIASSRRPCSSSILLLPRPDCGARRRCAPKPDALPEAAELNLLNANTVRGGERAGGAGRGCRMNAIEFGGRRRGRSAAARSKAGGRGRFGRARTPRRRPATPQTAQAEEGRRKAGAARPRVTNS